MRKGGFPRQMQSTMGLQRATPASGQIYLIHRIQMMRCHYPAPTAREIGYSGTMVSPPHAGKGLLSLYPAMWHDLWPDGTAADTTVRASKLASKDPTSSWT